MTIPDNQKLIYTQVYNVLLSLGEDYINKISHDVFEAIKNNRDENYEFKVNPDISLDEQELFDESIALLAYLKLEYWCQTDDEKKELQQLLKFNEEKQNNSPLSRESKAYWISKLKKKS